MHIMLQKKNHQNIIDRIYNYRNKNCQNVKILENITTSKVPSPSAYWPMTKYFVMYWLTAV